MERNFFMYYTYLGHVNHILSDFYVLYIGASESCFILFTFVWLFGFIE